MMLPAPYLDTLDRIIDRFFSERVPKFQDFFGSNFFERSSYPKIDVIEYDDKVQIIAELPGMDKKDINVTYQDGTLTISGSKADGLQIKGGKFIKREIKRSSFERSCSLNPQIFDVDNISASYENNFLTIDIPKKDSSLDSLKRIEVK